MNWISYEISVPVTNVLSTLVRLKVCVFLVIENTSWIDSRPHYRFDALIRKTFENDRIARLWCKLNSMLYAPSTNTRSWDIFDNCFHYDAFSSVHTNTICMRFRFDPLSRAFSNRCVISADGRPKRIEMYTFSNENSSVWTGPKRLLHTITGRKRISMWKDCGTDK